MDIEMLELAFKHINPPFFFTEEKSGTKKHRYRTYLCPQMKYIQASS